ncbi:MAG: hypothetical protein GEU94_08860 [Micromonosporaceae bacterium]|nr:hypothetical protein [Micromonosporaceae bacterium]
MTSARWLHRKGIVLASALAVLGSVVAGPTAASASVSTTENRQFNAGHLNILHSLSHERFAHDLNLITSRAGIVGLNEVADRRAFLTDWAARNGWHFYAPDPGHARDNALLAKKSMFDVVSRGSVFACDTNGPGEPPPARYTNWVRYQHKATGRYVFHLNTHANSHIDNNGHPYDLPRTECAEKHFRGIRDLADSKRSSGQVVVSGDLNVDYVADKRVQYVNFPYVVLDERGSTGALPGLRSNYTIHGVKGTGTLGDRHIDYIYLWKRLPEHQKMWMTDYGIVGGTESDHNAVVANFAIAMPG